MKYYVPSMVIRRTGPRPSWSRTGPVPAPAPPPAAAANIAAGSYAQLVYDQGYHALSFAGLPALILSQLFNVPLTGFPLVILLFPDGRLPSRRWRPVLVAYLAIAVVTVLGTAVAVLQVAIGHHPVLRPTGTSPPSPRVAPPGRVWCRECSSSQPRRSGWPP